MEKQQAEYQHFWGAIVGFPSWDHELVGGCPSSTSAIEKNWHWAQEEIASISAAYAKHEQPWEYRTNCAIFAWFGQQRCNIRASAITSMAFKKEPGWIWCFDQPRAWRKAHWQGHSSNAIQRSVSQTTLKPLCRKGALCLLLAVYCMWTWLIIADCCMPFQSDLGVAVSRSSLDKRFLLPLK